MEKKYTLDDKEVSYRKLELEALECKSSSPVCRLGPEYKQELRFSLLKTLLTMAAAALLGTAVIVFCFQFYQV